GKAESALPTDEVIVANARRVVVRKRLGAARLLAPEDVVGRVDYAVSVVVAEQRRCERGSGDDLPGEREMNRGGIIDHQVKLSAHGNRERVGRLISLNLRRKRAGAAQQRAFASDRAIAGRSATRTTVREVARCEVDRRLSQIEVSHAIDRQN